MLMRAGNQIYVTKHDFYLILAMLFTYINTMSCYYAHIYHYIVIVLCFLLMYSPEVGPIKYIHRRTIFNMFLHDNGI